MRKVNRRGLQALLAVSTLLMPRLAAAEPVTVTSGFVETELGLGLARVLFQGDNFMVRLGVEGFRTQVGLDCFPCAAGTTVNLGGQFSPVGLRAAGFGTVDGVTYRDIFADDMKGTFTTASFTLTGNTNVTVRLPFSFTGDIRGYVQDPFAVGFTDPAFTKTLSGHGIATGLFTFNDQDGAFFNVNDLRYDFGDTAPVPEPATFLLCGFGAAVLLLRRSRQLAR
jgi:PEP-CTERM motif